MRWKQGDHILYYPNVVYGACKDTLHFIRDHYGVELVPVEKVIVPMSFNDIIEETRKVIEATKEKLGENGRIVLGLMDAICSMPGVIMPWEDLCKLFKSYGILSLVDAAHLMGHLPVDLKKADPDFWVSNAHKWGMAARSVACFYVSWLSQVVPTFNVRTKQYSHLTPGAETVRNAESALENCICRVSLTHNPPTATRTS